MEYSGGNLSPRCHNISYKMCTDIKYNDSHAHITTSTHPKIFPNVYKPGGTWNRIGGKLHDRIRRFGSNSMGSWSWVYLLGKEDKH